MPSKGKGCGSGVGPRRSDPRTTKTPQDFKKSGGKRKTRIHLGRIGSRPK